MEAERVIVLCEPKPDWAIAARMVLQGTNVRVVEARTVSECWDEFHARGAVLAAIAIGPYNTSRLVSMVAEVASTLGKDMPWVALLPIAWRSERWATYILGPLHVFCSVRELTGLPALVNNLPDANPAPRNEWWHEMANRLPWPDAGKLVEN